MSTDYIQPTSEPIAIVGSSCRLPGNASSPSRLWSLIQNPRELSKDVPANRFNIDGFYNQDPEHQGTTNTKKAHWLEEDPTVFDASFFNITPLEAEAMDPQHRMLLEVTYEAMESAGLKMQAMRGSSTSVYVGTVGSDYDNIVMRDPLVLSRYTATGTHRSILSNRLSYFFDWRGPSMTIDTACSSSLVALHQGIQSLRTNECQTACIAGANLMLSPELFLTESALHMLSPEGKCHMWDERADGYARGEGIVVVFLKRLSDALADGDHIEAIIRDSGVNQDGRTRGITMPSSEAQATLIDEVYRRSGLDPTAPWGRCQYFEAHGTGTQVGDAREAEAIETAFFSPSHAQDSQAKSLNDDFMTKLYVGSIKTVIGHTEGTSGLASLLKVSLALQHGVIPPNQHFENLSNEVAPFYSHMQVPTTAQPWPKVPPGHPLRASVNSFGFGGTNAHVIVESFEPALHDPHYLQRSKEEIESPTLPLLFSASSEEALIATIAKFHQALRKNHSLNTHQLAWTLACRRSTLPIKLSFSGPTKKDLFFQMDTALQSVINNPAIKLGRERPAIASPKLLGIFTGQGAQWAAMGKQLILRNRTFRESIERLDVHLHDLPDGPEWSLKEELLKPPSESRIMEGPISQPLCSAVQMALVDLLNSIGVHFHTVIGHSSGELAAAYAAGYIRPRDAMFISYYRGLSTKYAGGRDGKRGTMLAAGIGSEEASVLINQPLLKDRIVIGTSNSPTSVTLSGDLSAIEEARSLLEAEGKFARILKVDNAYHSFHMNACAEPFLKSMLNANIQILKPDRPCSWISTVYTSDPAANLEDLSGPYWRDNMLGSVLFREALERAIDNGPFDMALEIGPHPALKASVSQTLKEKAGGQFIPYTGVLDRKKGDVVAFGEAIAYMWAHFGSKVVDFDAYATSFYDDYRSRPAVLKNLPSYSWDHTQTYWRESRVSKRYSYRDAPKELVGSRSPDDNDAEMRWRNVFSVKALPWLQHIKIRDRITIPASVYCAMALEVAFSMPNCRDILTVDLIDVQIYENIIIDTDSNGVEVIFTLQVDKSNANDFNKQDSIMASFNMSFADVCDDGQVKAAFSGNMVITLGNESVQNLPPVPNVEESLQELDIDRFYRELKEIGMTYHGPFCALSNLKRRLEHASAQVTDCCPSPVTTFMVNPTTIEAAVQTALAAFAAPEDGTLWSPFLVKRLGKISFDFRFSGTESRSLHSFAQVTDESFASPVDRSTFTADIQLADQSHQTVIQMEGIVFEPTIQSTANDDRILYFHQVWDVDVTNGPVGFDGLTSTEQRISRVARQFSHRDPKMRILEIAPNSGAVTSALLDGFGSAFKSYTLADIEASSGNLIHTSRISDGKEISKLKLDVGQPYDEQWPEVDSYDLVVIQPLLYQPQDYDMIISNVLSKDLKRRGHIVSIQKRYENSPSTNDKVQSDEWKTQLLNTGFVELGFPNVTLVGDKSEISIWQFNDSSMGCSYNPLKSGLATNIYGSLLLIGGQQRQISIITDQINALLRKLNINVVNLKTLKDFDPSKCSDIVGTLILQDLEEPLMNTKETQRMLMLKNVLSSSPVTMWLTQSFVRTDAYHSASLGLGRDMIAMHPNLRIQFFDLDTLVNIETLITEAFLRLVIAGSDTEQVFPSAFETHIRLEKGRILIPRLIPHSELNDRLNSVRRTIVKYADTATDEIEFLVQKDVLINGHSYMARLAKPHLRKDSDINNHLIVKVNYSTKYAFYINGAFAHICIGTSNRPGKTVITVAQSIASHHRVADMLVLDVDLGTLSEVAFLSMMGGFLLAQNVIQQIVDSKTAVLYDPEENIGSLVQQLLGDSNQSFVYLTDGSSGNRNGVDWVHVHPKSFLSAFRLLVPRDAGLFVDLSSRPGLENKILKYLPRNCCYLRKESILSTTASVHAKEDWRSVRKALFAAVSYMDSSTSCITQSSASSIIDISDLQNERGHESMSPLQVVNWTHAQPIPITQTPIDPDDLLSPSETYLVISLPNDLSEILCQWLVRHGARSLIILTMDHQVSSLEDAYWLRQLRRVGTTIEVVLADISVKHELVSSLYATTHGKQPKIGGVFLGPANAEQGSLEDTLAALNAHATALDNLDEVFSAPYDGFFVALSTLSRITGAPDGTTSSAASNMYTAALCARRRARGLGASLLDLTSWYGSQLDVRGSNSPGFCELTERVSERELHQAFSEAVAAGKLASSSISEITLGLHPVPRSSSNPLPALFTHLLEEPQDATSQINELEVSLPQRILSAGTDTDEALQILYQEFSLYLATALQLPVEGININTVIIDLGVDSLVAMEIRSWFSSEIYVDVTVLQILSGASILELCQAVLMEMKSGERYADPEESAVKSTSSAPLSENSSKPIMTPDTGMSMIIGSKLPMSFGQARVWFPYEYLENKTAYNCTTTYQLRGSLDVDRFEQALQKVIQRNSAFRTSFFTDPTTGEPYQVMHEISPFQLRKVVISPFTESSTQIEEEKRLVAEHIYDLGLGDTFIATLCSHRDDPNIHTIIFGYHHIIMDGVSWQLFLRDLDQCYTNNLQSHLSPVGQYFDFTVQQRDAVDSQVSMSHRKFWKEEFIDPPEPLAILPFAKSFTRKSLTRYDNIEVMLDLDRDLVSKIKKCSAAARVTTFHFYLSVLQVMLHRFLQVGDIVIGIVDAGRHNKASVDTIGFLIDLLPLRFNLADKEMIFAELLKSTRSKAYSAIGHAGIPFDIILQDVNPPSSSSSPPLFQVVMNYRMGVLGQKTIGDVDLDWSTYEDAKHPFDFILTVDENDGEAFLTLSLQQYLFDRAGGDLFLSTYIHLLEVFTEESSLKIQDAPLFNEHELKTAISLGKGPIDKNLQNDTLSLRVDNFVASQPHEIAIKDDSVTMTYQQMADRVNEIANAMLYAGVSTSSHVAMLLNPVADAICTILAIMRIGAVYIPLDVRNSEERLVSIVTQSKAMLVIFHDSTQDQLSKIQTYLPHAIRSVNISIVANDSRTVPNRSTADSPAFVMFTSGSTGKPKGVMLKHSNFLTHVLAASKEMDLRIGREVVLQQSAFGYDASLAQIFYALANGGSLVMTSNRGDMEDIAALMLKENITFMLASPSEYLILYQYGKEFLKSCTSWRIAMCGGEAFSSNLKQLFHDLNIPDLKVWNAYGPSEISVASSFHCVPYDAIALHDTTKVPIGRAITNYAVYILDPESAQPLPVGWVGEICIGGPAVSAGYLNNETMTMDRFIPDTISSTSASGWKSLYRTGDQGRMLSDGSIAYLGRIAGDSQIKLRGIRIELDEISISILQTSAGVVSNAAVCTWGEGQEQFLVAFVVFAVNQVPENADEYLHGLISSLPLPSYMRPAMAVPIDKLPMNASGKLDRRALRDLSLPEIVEQRDDDSLTDTEVKLKQIWTDVLANSQVKLQIRKQSDFFSVGGNSLLLLKMQRQIKQNLDKDIPLSELFQNSDLQTLARRLDNDIGELVTQSHIDWDAEIALPTDLHKPISQPATYPMEIVLTGSTGFLGRWILNQLSAHPDVAQIHCIAVRPKKPGIIRSNDMWMSEKVTTYAGDLSLPSLGLSEEDQERVFANAGAIIHCGADVSFMQTYTSLRKPNVQATKELVRMASARRSIPFHYVSTAGVVHLSGGDSYGEISVAAHRPPTDGSDGYVASKWASEVFLERCHREIGIPVSIYRPSSIIGPDAPSMDIMNNILRFSRLMKVIPRVAGWVGSMDLVDVKCVANNIINTVIDMHDHSKNTGSFSTVQYYHESGQTVVPVESVKEYLEKEEGVPFQTQNLDQWIESARKHGIDELVAEFLTTMHTSGQGPSMPLLITSRKYNTSLRS